MRGADGEYRVVGRHGVKAHRRPLPLVAIKAQLAAAKLGVAPAPLRVSRDRRVLVMEHLDAAEGWRPLRGHWDTVNTPELARALGRALGLLHRAGFAHNDCHCGNVFVRRTPVGYEVKFIDFAHADQLGATPGDDEGDIFCLQSHAFKETGDEEYEVLCRHLREAYRQAREG